MKKLNLGEYDQDPNSIYLFAYSFTNHQKEFLTKEFPGTFSPIYLTDEELIKKHQSTIALFDYILPTITAELNQTNKKDYPPIFWETFVAWWLVGLLDSIIDKKMKIEKFIAEANEKFLAPTVTCDNKSFFENDQAYSMAIQTSAQLSHFHCSLLLQGFNSPKLQIQNNLIDLCFRHNVPSRPFRTFDEIFYVHGQSHLEKILLKKIPSKSANNSLLSHTFKLDQSLLNLIDWKKIILSSIPESYYNLPEIVLPKKTPSFLIVPSGKQLQERAMVSLARTQGTRIYSHQHGSCYGDLLVTTRNYLCEYRLDGFISWGWTEHEFHPANIIPAPSYALSKIKIRKLLNVRDSKKIIFISSVFSANQYEFSGGDADSYQQYYEGIRQFLINLSPELQPHFWYRPRLTHNETTFNQAMVDLVIKEFPWVNILKGNLDREILSARLVIHDNAGSAFQKSLAANVPTIFCWNHSFIHWKRSITPIWEKLKNQNVYFENSIAAAQFINKNYHDIQKWWQSPLVSKPIVELKASLFRTSFFPFWDWVKIIRKL